MQYNRRTFEIKQEMPINREICISGYNTKIDQSCVPETPITENRKKVHREDKLTTVIDNYEKHRLQCATGSNSQQSSPQPAASTDERSLPQSLEPMKE
jgi:hypothetical protein